MTNNGISEVSAPLPTNYLAHGNLVAGAAAEGHGALTDWFGRGERTHANVLQWLDHAKLPADWAPRVKDASVQLGRAMQHVATGRYTAKPVRHSRDAAIRETEKWDARWILVTLPTAEEVQAGAKFGDIALVATLYDGDEQQVLQLETESTEDPALFSERETLKGRVRQQFNALVGAQVHHASDITAWLGSLLRRECKAVRYGRSYYIPAEYRPQVEALTGTMRLDGWGAHWMYPMLPVATSAQLGRGIALAFEDELTDFANDLAIARQAAVEAGRTDIGSRALETAKLKLQAIMGRAFYYANILGDGGMEIVEERRRDIEVTFEEIEQNIALTEATK